MPKKMTAYQAEDGTLHEGECEAATRDVEIMVANSPLNENQPFARMLVEWLTSNSKTIRAKLEAHERACPHTDAAEPAPEEAEGTRSSVEAKRPLICAGCGALANEGHPYKHPRVLIPSRIYWDSAAQGFYDADSRQRMGEAFHRDWAVNSLRFPSAAEAAMMLARGPARAAGDEIDGDCA